MLSCYHFYDALLGRICETEGLWSLTFSEQLETSQLELDRRREECIQLHSVLANQTKGLKSVASNNYSSHIDIINEDGELVLAFEAQKKINR
jgi:myosin-5